MKIEKQLLNTFSHHPGPKTPKGKIRKGFPRHDPGWALQLVSRWSLSHLEPLAQTTEASVRSVPASECVLPCDGSRKSEAHDGRSTWWQIIQSDPVGLTPKIPSACPFSSHLLLTPHIAANITSCRPHFQYVTLWFSKHHKSPLFYKTHKAKCILIYCSLMKKKKTES